jgi:uncharacterized protein (DUF1697 family)
LKKYVALLRGINVGGHKKVPMTDLKKFLEKAGFQNVRTLLASGNVVFSQRDGLPESEEENINKLLEKISTILEKKFGFSIPVLLRKFSEIEDLIKLNPFKDIKVTPQIRLYATFLPEKLKKKTSVSYTSPDKSFKIISAEKDTIFSVLDLTKSKTPEAMGILEKEFGKNITTRNWNTVVKISKL